MLLGQPARVIVRFEQVEWSTQWSAESPIEAMRKVYDALAMVVANAEEYRRVSGEHMARVEREAAQINEEIAALRR